MMFAVPAVFGHPEGAIRTEWPRVRSSLSRGFVGLFVYKGLGGGKLFFFSGQLAIDQLVGSILDRRKREPRERTVSPSHPVVMVTAPGGWGNMAAAKASACSVCV